jgi:hypothetical protein
MPSPVCAGRPCFSRNLEAGDVQFSWAAVEVMNAGLPIAAPHAASSMSTTGRGQLPAVSLRNSSGDSSAKVIRRPKTSPMMRICAAWLNDSGVQHRHRIRMLDERVRVDVRQTIFLGCVDGAPALLGGLDQLDCHGDPGGHSGTTNVREHNCTRNTSQQTDLTSSIWSQSAESLTNYGKVAG